MDDIEEKRVFGERAGGTSLLVAAAVGVLSVGVSADRVGEFGVAHRCSPTDVAAAGGLVAVASDDDVLVRPPGGEDFEPTGFGPAVAVGVETEGEVVAASDDGRLARLVTDATEPSWTDLGHLDAAVRAIDPPLLAAADGLHRLPGLDYVGLEDANDVAAAGPLAATGEGLYSLGNGWMDELDGDFRVAATDGERAHAATGSALFERRDGDWREVDLPADGRVVDLAYVAVPFAVTRDGVVLAEGGDGWRATPLGVDGVVGCVVG